MCFLGLGICNPVSLATNLFNSSVHGTEHLVNSIVGIEIFELDSHFNVFPLISLIIDNG